MSYKLLGVMQNDRDLTDRTIACAALEGIIEPQRFAYMYAWELCAHPGWAAAYASAKPADGAQPGSDENAITDELILASVRRVVAAVGPTAHLERPSA